MRLAGPLSTREREDSESEIEREESKICSGNVPTNVPKGNRRESERDTYIYIYTCTYIDMYVC